MESENETVSEAIAAVRKMIHECPAIKGGLGEFEYQLKANGAIYLIESAWRREKAELQLAIDAEKARHTDDYKDERIRAQDEEIRTLKSEMKPRRNCDRFASYKEAVNAWNAMSEYEREKHNQLFNDWLFAQVADGGEK